MLNYAVLIVFLKTYFCMMYFLFDRLWHICLSFLSFWTPAINQNSSVFTWRESPKSDLSKTYGGPEVPITIRKWKQPQKVKHKKHNRKTKRQPQILFTCLVTNLTFLLLCFIYLLCISFCGCDFSFCHCVFSFCGNVFCFVVVFFFL